MLLSSSRLRIFLMEKVLVLRDRWHATLFINSMLEHLDGWTASGTFHPLQIDTRPCACVIGFPLIQLIHSINDSHASQRM